MRNLNLTVLTCLVCMATPGTLSAQEAEPPAQAEAAEATVVSGIVFGEDQLPRAGVVVLIGETSLVTNKSGGFETRLAAGAHKIEVNGIVREFTVGEGAVEILVTLVTSGAEFDIEGGATVVEDTPVVQEIAAPGILTGTVVSMEGGKPVADARVFVRGQEIEARTDKAGRFEISLPAGSYDVSVIHPDYSSQDSPEVVVDSDKTRDIRVELSPASVMLEDFTVSAPRIEGSQADLLEERKDSSNVMEVLGAEQMSKSGASDAADALSRVTGITIVGGKYVYVRGLGDRYSSTLLNGAGLPSPEPEKRVVPLDLFPTNMLESVIVQKNYSPNMPGEFGGGVVELRTRRLPSEFEADVGVSVGYRSGSTFETAPTYEGGAWDWLGFDDGTRALPDNVLEASQESPLLEGDRFSDLGYTPSELEELGESLPNTWEAQEMTLPLNLGVDGSIGDKLKLGSIDTGYRLGFTWSQDWKYIKSNEKYFRIGAGEELELRNQYDFATATREIVLGFIFTTGLEFSEDHAIYLTSLLDRVSDDEYREYQGFNRDAGDNITVTRYRWVERTLLYEQLRGEHRFKSLADLEFDWHYVFSQALRAEPDRREYRYDDRTDGSVRLSDRPEGNSRVFSDLVDTSHDVKVEFALPYKVWSDLEARAVAGAATLLKNREVDTRRFAFSILERGDVLELAPEDLFTPDNIGPDASLQLTENTRSTDNYLADQQIFAGYMMTDLPLTKTLALSGGVRLEYSSQNVETFELFNPDGDAVSAELSTFDPLPAISLSWAFVDDMQLRLAGSRTVSRPDFRELSPLLFSDVAGGRAVQGNPDLERALITHADARWEWYPSKTETVSVGAFTKLFDSPIESEIRPGAQPLLTFQNAESALNVGVEVEAKKNFGFMTDALKDAFFAANFSVIHSTVQLAESGSQTNKERPLQGQSPWVVNVMLGWDNVEIGTSATLLYNVSGRRIDSVGALGLPDVYEEPVHRLDFVYKQKLGESGLKLSFKASNLIDSPIEFSQGDLVKETRTEGRKFSLGVGYDF